MNTQQIFLLPNRVLISMIHYFMRKLLKKPKCYPKKTYTNSKMAIQMVSMVLCSKDWWQAEVDPNQFWTRMIFEIYI